MRNRVAMQSSLIGKIDKARRYAEDKDRVILTEFEATFQGDHGTHAVSYRGGKWHCSCHFFAGWGVCSHSMALQRLLGGILPVAER